MMITYTILLLVNISEDALEVDGVVTWMVNGCCTEVAGSSRIVCHNSVSVNRNKK